MRPFVRYMCLLLVPLVALAATTMLLSPSSAQPLRAIAITELNPPNGSTITAGQTVTVSTFIESDVSIDTKTVAVTLDGSPLNVQLVVGSRAERVGFNTTLAFTAGTHAVTVTASNTSGERAVAQSTFTATEAATTAPSSPTSAPTAQPSGTSSGAGTATAGPARLPRTGGIPLDVLALALLSMGFLAAAIGLRLRIR